jgi:hypothetical protein
MSVKTLYYSSYEMSVEDFILQQLGNVSEDFILQQLGNVNRRLY